MSFVKFALLVTAVTALSPSRRDCFNLAVGGATAAAAPAFATYTGGLLIR